MEEGLSWMLLTSLQALMHVIVNSTSNKISYMAREIWHNEVQLQLANIQELNKSKKPCKLLKGCAIIGINDMNMFYN